MGKTAAIAVEDWESNVWLLRVKVFDLSNLLFYIIIYKAKYFWRKKNTLDILHFIRYDLGKCYPNS